MPHLTAVRDVLMQMLQLSPQILNQLCHDECTLALCMRSIPIARRILNVAALLALSVKDVALAHHLVDERTGMLDVTT